MGSYRHYLLFPEVSAPIALNVLLDRLAPEGWKVELEAFVLGLDTDGAITASRDVHLSAKSPTQIQTLLRDDQRLLCVLAHDQMPLNINFGPASGLTVQTISHSAKVWNRLNDDERTHTEGVLARAINDAGADWVLIVNDPPDDILGRVTRVDDKWVVDLNVPGMNLDPCVMWLRNPDVAPAMRNLKPTQERRSVYQLYIETP
ncbi:MAG TPA: hypothetical protein VJN18_33415 [Polyangiaceae bacterium]|nr:hypothetical protein [Polyangiaceae bacterium]